MEHGQRKKVIGVLGGMGPESTADFFLRVIRGTPAERDQDHFRIIIDNNPLIPDRTEGIFSGNTGPVIAGLQETAHNLEQAGADFIVMPCNTAHYFLDEIQAAVSIPVVDMTSAVADCVLRHNPPINQLALMATTATVRTNLYHRALEKAQVRVLAPDSAQQDQLMSVILRIKGSGVDANDKRLTRQLAERLIEAGAQAIISGCTEISLVLGPDDLAVPLFDSTQILAETAIRLAQEQ